MLASVNSRIPALDSHEGCSTWRLQCIPFLILTYLDIRHYILLAPNRPHTSLQVDYGPSNYSRKQGLDECSASGLRTVHHVVVGVRTLESVSCHRITSLGPRRPQALNYHFLSVCLYTRAGWSWTMRIL